MASITVRVVPRSARVGVEAGPGGVIVRVRAAPEAGRANEEAVRALAGALGVTRARVRLRSGGRSRTKVFDVEGLSADDLLRRLHAF